MGVDIRLPNITATSADGQMTQMKSYLHQLVQQLNFALNTVNEAQAGNTSSVVMSKQSEDISPEEAVDTFNSIKSLIIKSADIVKAYEETIFTDFNGRYFAESDFGTFIETTNRKVEENSKGVTEAYTNVQAVSGALGVVEDEVRSTNAYIKRGYLGEEDGKAVYGIAVGETDDNGVYKKYAWFTSNKLSFFDGNDDKPVAYISANKLHINNAEFSGVVLFGGYKADMSDGLAFTWIGG
jgi:hypothetical protein